MAAKSTAQRSTQRQESLVVSWTAKQDEQNAGTRFHQALVCHNRDARRRARAIKRPNGVLSSGAPGLKFFEATECYFERLNPSHELEQSAQRNRVGRPACGCDADTCFCVVTHSQLVYGTITLRVDRATATRKLRPRCSHTWEYWCSRCPSSGPVGWEKRSSCGGGSRPCASQCPVGLKTAPEQPHACSVSILPRH